MDTVILRTEAVVDTDQNLKHYVFKKLGLGTLYRIQVRSQSDEITTMFVYNSEASVSGAGGSIQLSDTYDEGDDVVRVYDVLYNGTDTWLTVTFDPTVTKVLFDSKGATYYALCSGNSTSEINALGANLKNLAMHIPKTAIGNTFQYQYSYIYGEMNDILELIGLTSYGINCSQDVGNRIHGNLVDLYEYIQLDTTKWQTVTFRGESIKRYFMGVRYWDINGDAYELMEYLASEGLRSVGVGWSTTGTQIRYKSHLMRGASFTTWIDENGDITCWNGDTNTGW